MKNNIDARLNTCFPYEPTFCAKGISVSFTARKKWPSSSNRIYEPIIRQLFSTGAGACIHTRQPFAAETHIVRAIHGAPGRAPGARRCSCASSQLRSRAVCAFQTHLRLPWYLMLPVPPDRFVDNESTWPRHRDRAGSAGGGAAVRVRDRPEGDPGADPRPLATATLAGGGPSRHPGSPIPVNPTSDRLTDQAGKHEPWPSSPADSETVSAPKRVALLPGGVVLHKTDKRLADRAGSCDAVHRPQGKR